MFLNLDDLGLRGGHRHECAYTVGVAPVTLGGAEYETLLPEGVTVSVDRVAGGFLVRLAFDAKAYGPCSLCLGETELVVHGEQEEFVPTAAGGWAESESSPFIKDMVVDVSALAREALVLAMPDRVLCSATCRGLCAQCGKDLNRGSCGCTTLEITEPIG